MNANNMQFNANKFRLLSYFVGGSALDSRVYQAPDGSDIKTATEIQDSGITMSSSGKFGRHIER